jgi:hypothetical protein
MLIATTVAWGLVLIPNLNWRQRPALIVAEQERVNNGFKETEYGRSQQD